MQRPERHERHERRETREGAREAELGVLAAADRLLRETVTATAAIDGESGRAVGRLLREVAATALARVAAACREPRERRALRALDAARYFLERLRTWIDLAGRFGDLTPAALQAVEQARADLGDRLEALAAAWRRDSADRARASADDLAEGVATIELQVPPPGALPSGSDPSHVAARRASA